MTSAATASGTPPAPAPAPGAAPPPDPTTTAPEWIASLPDELKQDKTLLQVKDIPSLAKAYVDAQKYVGTAVRMPKDDAPKDEWDAFYTKLGRPAKLEEYGVKSPEFDPELGVSVDEAAVREFSQHFFELGLTPKQAQGVLDKYGDYVLRTLDGETRTNAARRTEVETGLKQEWGATYGRNIALARQAIKDLFGDSPQLAKAVENAGNDPDLVKGLVRIGERMLEHGEITGEVPPGETEASLQAEIARLRKLEESDPTDMTNTEKKLAATRRLLKMGGKVPTS